MRLPISGLRSGQEMMRRLKRYPYAVLRPGLKALGSKIELGVRQKE